MTRTGRGMRRCWRRLRGAVAGSRADLFRSPDYRLDLGGTRIDPRRVDNIVAFLLREQLVSRAAILSPQPASLKDLARVHTREYLSSLRRKDALLPIVGFRVNDDLTHRALESQRSAVGGTMAAVAAALRGHRPAINLGGGFHHAGPSSGQGFCIFNDIAVAIAEARQSGFRGNVLVVDLDLHDGNGTRRAFTEDPTVFTFSIHNRTWDPSPAVASLSIELEGEVEDDRYLETIRQHLPDLLRSHRPELVIYLAGTDPAEDDALGNWRISASGMLERDRLVVSAVRRGGSARLVVVLAGGYGRKTWRYSARFFSWILTGGRAIEPPTTSEMTRARNRQLARLLESPDVTTDPAGSAEDLWHIDSEDIYGMLGGGSRRTRFLNHFSPHGIELLLERSGLLDLLRGAGFPNPTVVVDLHHPAGQSVRVFGDSGRKELLIETRLARDRRTLEGFELLRIEWLLMQNPRGRFSSSRPALPGQNNPGLGLLGEMMSLIVLLAEQLGLDGVLFIPSHYHLAAQARKYLHFCHPADEAWYLALRSGLGELPLAEATLSVAAGQVIDQETAEPVPWRPMPMVLPLSDGLKQHFASAEYGRATERLRGQQQRMALAASTPSPGTSG